MKKRALSNPSLCFDCIGNVISFIEDINPINLCLFQLSKDLTNFLKRERSNCCKRITFEFYNEFFFYRESKMANPFVHKLILYHENLEYFPFSVFFPNLKELRLHMNIHLSEDSLKGLNNLTHLGFGNNNNITVETIEKLPNLLFLRTPWSGFKKF